MTLRGATARSGAEAATTYSPEVMPVKEYDPSSPATAVFAVPALAVSVIFAPGTIAPDSSVTTPRKVPFCANKADEKKSETMRPSSNFISQIPNSFAHSFTRGCSQDYRDLDFWRNHFCDMPVCTAGEFTSEDKALFKWRKPGTLPKTPTG